MHSWLLPPTSSLRHIIIGEWRSVKRDFVVPCWFSINLDPDQSDSQDGRTFYSRSFTEAVKKSDSTQRKRQEETICLVARAQASVEPFEMDQSMGSHGKPIWKPRGNMGAGSQLAAIAPPDQF